MSSLQGGSDTLLGILSAFSLVGNVILGFDISDRGIELDALEGEQEALEDALEKTAQMLVDYNDMKVVTRLR